VIDGPAPASQGGLLERNSMVTKLTNLRERIINTFSEFGGWWPLEGMAEWLGVSPDEVSQIWDELEAEGLLERKREGRLA